MHFTTQLAFGLAGITFLLIHLQKANGFRKCERFPAFSGIWSIKAFFPVAAFTGLSRTKNINFSIDEQFTIYPLSSRSYISTFCDFYTGSIIYYSHAAPEPASRFAFTRAGAMLRGLLLFNRALMFFLGAGMLLLIGGFNWLNTDFTAFCKTVQHSCLPASTFDHNE